MFPTFCSCPQTTCDQHASQGLVQLLNATENIQIWNLLQLSPISPTIVFLADILNNAA